MPKRNGIVVAAEVSMLDTDTWLVLSCAGCANKAREGEETLCTEGKGKT